MIEKVFAINAEPGVVWDALWSDLNDGEAGAFEVEAAHRPTDISLKVMLSGVPSQLIYRLEPKDGHTEVAALIVPSGLRYGISQVLTFGHFKRNFEMILVEGLANLKASIEGPEEDEAVPDLDEATEP